MAEVLSPEEFSKIDRYWRAANYLSVGQIYLRHNALLREPLRAGAHQAATAGSLGNDAGLELHLRSLKPADPEARARRDLHHRSRPRRPGDSSRHTYLEGTYTELYPDIARTEEGIQKLFNQFSWPGGIPSHAAPETPGSINEGGELGYCLLHALRRRARQPRVRRRLRRRRRRGGNRAVRDELALEQVRQSRARRRGPAHPPPRTATRSPDRPILARLPEEELRSLFVGYG